MQVDSPIVPPFTHYKENFSITIQVLKNEDTAVSLVVEGYVKAYDTCLTKTDAFSGRTKHSPWFREEECDKILSFIENNLPVRGFKGVKHIEHGYGKEYFYIQTIESTTEQSLNLIVGNNSDAKLISRRGITSYHYFHSESPIISDLTPDWKSYVWNSEIATISLNDDNPHDTVNVNLSRLGGDLWNWEIVPTVKKPLLVDPEVYNQYNQQGTWEYVILRYVIGLHSEKVIRCGLKHTMNSFLHTFYYDRYPMCRSSNEEAYSTLTRDIREYDDLLKELAWYNSTIVSGQKPSIIPRALAQPLIYDALAIQLKESTKIYFLATSIEFDEFVPKFTVYSDHDSFVFDFSLEQIYIGTSDFETPTAGLFDLDYEEIETILFKKLIESKEVERLNGLGLNRRYDFNILTKFPFQYKESIVKAINAVRKYLTELDEHFAHLEQSYRDDEDRQERYWTEAADFDGLPKYWQDDNDPFDGDPSAYWNID
ncbi:hypothetical protein CLV58_113123 [Spirosoma oryzae]|uniref:Uncharacterized protein n=1 Tax=Spirosoma oryzae TaxID=1469603 RepID=A0A2T0SRE9_9BACT|nr:hypothetical protein [Spirosoma oryzae]PRY35992.1 hypothetical protein CLV58_113123 [Spirosoma oryzae]